MIYEHLFERAGDKRVRAGLIGAGAYGTSLLAQARSISHLEVPVVCDQDIKAAQRACQQAGITEEAVTVCDSRKQALAIIEAGKCVITQDHMLLMDLPLEVIVECTGNPEAGARHADLAIKHGKHVAMVNKETDSVVGPMLHRLAKDRGVVYTPVDGDQHGLLIGLVSWARKIGLEVVCGGKAHARDFVYDEAARTVTGGLTEKILTEGEMKALQKIPWGEAARVVERRREVLKDLGHIAEADLCESVIAANATALMADIPSLHGPIVRTTEIPEVLCPEETGGILSLRGAIDVVICLRKSDEAGLAGGVFVVFACESDYVWDFLKSKGILANRRGSYGLIYRPYHLLGVETPISILCAGLLNVSTGGLTVEPRVDLVARTACDLKAGSIINVFAEASTTAEASAVVEGSDAVLEPLITPSISVEDPGPVPLHMATGNRLSMDVSAGTVLTTEMIEKPAASCLWALRREQDRVFQIAQGGV